jgi:hypothetical protein
MVFTIIMLFTSCNNSLVYKADREWHFIVKCSNSSVIDTLILKTYDDSFEKTQRRIEYIYNKIKDSNGNYSDIIETTGVIDRQGNFFTRLFTKPEIWLHPPRNRVLRVTELLPFPWIKFPIEIGQSHDWELTPKEGWGEMKGKKINGKIEVVKRIFYDNPIVKDTCWLLEGVGESDFGKFECKYYFNEKSGFVYFFYNFNTYQIELVPISIKL